MHSSHRHRPWTQTVAARSASAEANTDVDAVFEAAIREEEAAAAEESGLSVLNIMLIGVTAAFVALNSRPLSMVPRMLMTLVHELGHTIAGWLFGYPTIPALDFMYGGGVAIHGARSGAVVFLLTGIVAAGAYRIRRHTWLLGTTLTMCAAVVLIGLTSAHQFVIAGAGHWAELTFGAIFLYRALSGSAVVHRIERPLYAFLGMFFILHNVRFSYRLMTNAYYRQLYDEGKATVHRMDFSRMAEEFLRTDIVSVATMHLIICVVPIACAFGIYFTRELWRPKLHDLVSVL